MTLCSSSMRTGHREGSSLGRRLVSLQNSSVGIHHQTRGLQFGTRLVVCVWDREGGGELKTKKEKK